MKKRARVLGFVIGSETECKSFFENIAAKRVLLSHQTGTKISFLARTTLNATENMQASENIR